MNMFCCLATNTLMAGGPLELLGLHVPVSLLLSFVHSLGSISVVNSWDNVVYGV